MVCRDRGDADESVEMEVMQMWSVETEVMQMWSVETEAMQMWAEKHAEAAVCFLLGT